MGKFKDVTILEKQNSVIQYFNSPRELPTQIQEYLISQDYYLFSNNYTITEEHETFHEHLYFMGSMAYHSKKLTYSIRDNDTGKLMIINTDTDCSFFEMNYNSFFEKES